MSHEGSSINSWLFALVICKGTVKFNARPLFYQYIIPTRYLPQNPAEPKEICRSFNKLVLLVDDNVLLSQREESPNFPEQDEKSSWLQVLLPAWLRDDRLSKRFKHHKLNVGVLRLTQSIALLWLMVSIFITYRPCDSRNLNLNPLCMLDNRLFPKLWTDRVKQHKHNIDRYVFLLRGRPYIT